MSNEILDNHTKRASTSVEIHPPLAGRYSPRALAPTVLRDDEVRALFEAARWAPSCFNDQPWRFVAARTGTEGFRNLAEALTGGNRGWAPQAGLLVAVYAKTHRADGTPNRYAWHDVGLATSALMTEATVRGLGVHAMGGFDAEVLARTVPSPEGFEVVSLLAVGRLAPMIDGVLDAPYDQLEKAPRMRKPLDEVFVELA